MTAGLEINVIQPWNALAMCLCVFYQGPWLEGEEKGVLFVPSLPVIIFIMNLSLAFRQLGPVPIWRDLQSARAASLAWLFPEITWLEIQSLFFLQGNTVPLNSKAFIFRVWMIQGFIIKRKWEWFYFHPYLNKQAHWVPKYPTYLALVCSATEKLLFIVSSGG